MPGIKDIWATEDEFVFSKMVVTDIVNGWGQVVAEQGDTQKKKLRGAEWKEVEGGAIRSNVGAPAGRPDISLT